METKMYNSKLRALLSIRNFKKALKNHYEQMQQIEESLEVHHRNAVSVIETHCSNESQLKWKKTREEVKRCIGILNEILQDVQKRVMNKEVSDTVEIWNKFDLNERRLKVIFEESEILGYELLPDVAHKHWQKDICAIEETLLNLIISHAEACKLELQMIEKYTPKELNEITKIIANHVPDNFTFEEADEYEKDYLQAIDDVRKEFKTKKNLWDKFLDILAGGKHQSPAEKVMMKRWLEGGAEVGP